MLYLRRLFHLPVNLPWYLPLLGQLTFTELIQFLIICLPFNNYEPTGKTAACPRFLARLDKKVWPAHGEHIPRAMFIRDRKFPASSRLYSLASWYLFLASLQVKLHEIMSTQHVFLSFTSCPLNGNIQHILILRMMGLGAVYMGGGTER